MAAVSGFGSFFHLLRTLKQDDMTSKTNPHQQVDPYPQSQNQSQN